MSNLEDTIHSPEYTSGYLTDLADGGMRHGSVAGLLSTDRYINANTNDLPVHSTMADTGNGALLLPVRYISHLLHSSALVYVRLLHADRLPDMEQQQITMHGRLLPVSRPALRQGQGGQDVSRRDDRLCGQLAASIRGQRAHLLRTGNRRYRKWVRPAVSNRSSGRSVARIG